MLSATSSSLLISGPQSALAIVSGDAAAPAGGETAPGFAELLNDLAAKTVKDASTEDGAADPAATATESGKILPVALPETATIDDKTDTTAEGETVATKVNDLSAMLPLPGMPPLQQVSATSNEPAVPAAKASRRSAGAGLQALARAAAPALNQPTDKQKPETPVVEGRPAAAVAITVAAPVQALASQAVDASEAKPVTPLRPKPARAADLLRIEAPQASAPAPAVTQVAQADPSAQAVNAAVPTMSVRTPSPTDIDAALDHLVAAREALMPAEAALAIDHAEFGAVSIKIEQSSDGRISAELSAADPELKRAVTAATAADRGQTMTSEGDNGRSAQMANQRGSTASGDAATSERGQSGTQAGTDREQSQRRTQTRSQAREATSDQRPGVFA